MQEKVLTDNVVEFIKVIWDGERFTLVQIPRVSPYIRSLIILNPKEMLDLIEFAGKLGGE